ncbi:MULTISPECIES: FAD-dependent oxidoreductase [unclassified Halomonas]|uniref:NAD(P)/FAD-dependent oxidoreductase n=1 Tax=unclassified Halomonas TaxID=2609666 RepID=UPI0005FA2059|nr:MULTISPECIES: FAD-dependent oxidoreductase [unclassified Halomonas]KJZ09992.1 FAD-dependent oxidoreductase [Halomonas sp. S2151]MCO7216633.1 FAD-binding oxidoreductase [Halomonas sp. OfavH-34-E]
MQQATKTSSSLSDVVVVGGGLVGLAVGVGLARQGLTVRVLDEGDLAIRASRGNFGLVWVQGKGDNLPQYATISRRSAARWPRFAEELRESTGIDLQLEQRGGLYLCQTQQELQARHAMLRRMREDAEGDYPFEVLDLQQARDFIPELGDQTAGATWCPEDGHVNPLRLLRALMQRFIDLGGKLETGGRVERIDHRDGAFRLQTAYGRYSAAKVVLAAGLGNRDLAPQVGLTAPVSPNRGQVLIAERVRPFLCYPTGHVRQTGEGTIQIGDSKEDVGFDTATTNDVMAHIAARALRFFPLLRDVQLIRAWSALRVMTPDGYPLYEASTSHPGAYLVTCHSGVTLAAFHEGPLADWIGGAPTDQPLEVFRAQRLAL